MKVFYRGTLPTDPASAVVNTQPAGIGRVTALPQGLAVNNLGRNLEFLRLEEGRSVSARRFAATDFPDQDEPSQFDLDFHAVVVVEEAELLLALNHFGALRAFPMGEAWHGEGHIEPIRTWRWPGDVVRAVSVGGCLVSTGSAGYEVDDPVMPGVLVSDPIQADRPSGPLAHRVEHAELGVATELAADAPGRRVVAAFEESVAAFAVEVLAGRGIRIGPALWRAETECRVAWLAIDAVNDIVWAAGPDPSAASTAGANDWDALTGGEVVALDRSTGAVRSRLRFPVRLAWGNGGVPLALAPMGAGILGIDAEGSLWGWEWPMGSGAWRVRGDERPGHRQARAGAAGAGGTIPPAISRSRSLGIAHMARIGNRVFCGFNRDGYRLHEFALEP